ncbi:hypothetical protein Peur_054377 [Populus x canadensis]
MFGEEYSLRLVWENIKVWCPFDLSLHPRADVSLNYCSGCFSVAFQSILPNKPKIQIMGLGRLKFLVSFLGCPEA